MNIFQPGAENVVISLLLIASMVAIAVQYIRMPYTVALVLVGLGVGILEVLPRIHLEAHVILVLFLPALLFEASIHLDFDHLREDLGTIMTLAVLGVLTSTLIIGGILYWGSRVLGYHLTLAGALLFGALISATDPVAVLAMFRKLGAPQRLSYIMEGESLFNDGTAIVLFGILLLAIQSNALSLIDGTLHFLRVSLGGAALGGLAGYLFARAIQRLDDYLIEVTLTTILAYGTYLVAEQVAVSGVIAVVTAGIVVGNYGFAIGMSPTTRVVLTQIWEYIGFIANSLIFLLIGLGINLLDLLNNLGPILIGIGAILAARAIVVHLYAIPIDRFFWRLPMAWRHVLFWGGLRGAIALALALSLPSYVGEQRELLRIMAFGIVLFTLVGQGFTMPYLLRWLRLGEPLEVEREYERRWGRLYALGAAWERLEQLHRAKILSDPVWQDLNHAYTTAGHHLSEEIQQLFEQHRELHRRELQKAQREGLLAERSALNDLLRRGLISEGVHRQLIRDVDQRLTGLDEMG